MKTSKFLVFVIVLIIGATNKTTAQYNFSDDLYYDHPITYELGASAAVMNCFTDLGGKKSLGQKYFKDYNIGNSQIAGSVFFAAHYKYAIGLRIEGTFGKVTADDNALESIKENTFGRYERNLSFKSNIIEVMLAAELHPRYLLKKYYEGEKLPRLSPYLMGGIGFFSFKPEALINGQWVELHPLRTEGQGFAEYPGRKPYKLKQLNFPVGIGLKYKASPLCNISIECVSRILRTDYLDDVSTEYVDPALFSNYLEGADLSNALQLHDRQGELNPGHVTVPGDQRGNSSNKDSYFTVNIKFALVF